MLSEENAPMGDRAVSAVGYRRPPAHSRFKPGQSGNPKGRAKGSKNLKTLFSKILNEPVSLREGSVVRKMTKAEAILRGLVVGALKGDSRNLVTLFKLAEQTGQFKESGQEITEIHRIIVGWMPPDEFSRPHQPSEDQDTL